MSETLKDIEARVRSLPPEERAALAEILLESLREQPDAEIEQAWEQEVERRVAAYDRGELEVLSAESVFAEARRLAR